MICLKTCSSLTGQYFASSLQRNFQRVRRMSKINNCSEVLPHINAFHAAWNSLKGGEALCSNFRFDSQSIRCSNQRSETIRNVICPNQLAFNRHIETFILRLKANPRWTVMEVHGTHISIVSQSITHFIDFDKSVEEVKRFYVIAVDHAQPWVSLPLWRCDLKA